MGGFIMAVILRRIPSESSAYFPHEQDQIFADLILKKFRRIAADNDKMKNIMEMQEFTFSDSDIYGFIKDAIDDINSGYPRTDFSISELSDESFIVNGALVRAFMSKGILEIKNSVLIQDQGVQINTYDKGPNFQSIASYYAQEFQSQKISLKGALQFNNMFVGIPSNRYY
jgi:hypothetical protein